MTMMQGLPLTGVSTSVTIKNRAEKWQENCLRHIVSMHKLLSSIYDGLESDDVYAEDDNEDVKIKKGDTTQHTDIFADHCFTLINLLSTPTKGPVELPVVKILSVLTRCLKLSFADVLALPSRKDLTLLLPRLHQSCMDVLSHLILCCGADILPQSHTIIDLCLQTIVSTGKMCAQARFCTRSSVYQALVLWVRTLGWGRYLTHHSKLLIREIVADTAPSQEGKLAKKMDDESTPKEEVSKRRRKKGKKSQKGDSYLELETAASDTSHNEQNTEERLDLVIWAFSLSQLVVENLPFSLSQNLTSNIVKTASAIQRRKHQLPHPYQQGEAREGLYKALAACLLSTLDYGANRHLTVNHYQMTNTALDLLSRACHEEDSKVQTVCTHSLDILKASGNLKGPVIRKKLDEEDTELEDASQLMREKEELTDSISDLRSKLMTSEMENEQQSRLIANLREQIDHLQAKNSESVNEKLQSSQHDSMSNVSDDDNNEEEDDDDDDDGEEVEMENDDENCINNITTRVGAENSQAANNNMTESRKVDQPSCLSSRTTEGVIKDTVGLKQSSPTTDIQDENTQPQNENKVIAKKLSKRAYETEVPEADSSKRSKVDTDDNKATTTRSEPSWGLELDDMLQDFVDAPPDV